MTTSAGKMETILTWMRAKDTRLDVRMCAAAAADGELDVLKCLREIGCEWDEGTCINAAKGGHIEVLRWAHGNGCPWHMVKTTNVEVQMFQRVVTCLVETQAAIPGLPDHLVDSHMLRSEYFDDPADLAWLTAVSNAMRTAVAETGLRFKELGA